MPQRLNFIGCGQLGKTLGSLWHQSGSLVIGDILTRSGKSAQAAVDSIGAGRAVANIDDMQSADLYLIASADDAIEACSDALAESGMLNAANIVFHCSGSQSSALLSACEDQGAHTASIHPIKSFADVGLAVRSFAGTHCGAEGEPEALTLLSSLFEAIGAKLLPIHAEHKTLYHAASVIASNYLVTLQEISIQSFEQAGLSRTQAMQVLQPIVSGTVDNVFTVGTHQALTGPIARGDSKVVAEQLAAIKAWESNFAEIYRLLGLASLPMADAKNTNKPMDLDAMKAILNTL